MQIETVFEELPVLIKQSLEDAPPGYQDWKTCGNCGAHMSTVKLRKCMRCSPHKILPHYYCSTDCQKAQWKLHKEECEDSVQLPLTKDLRGNPYRKRLKYMEQWYHIHRNVLERTLTHAILSNWVFGPSDTSVFLLMDFDKSHLEDPPLARPVKLVVTQSQPVGEDDEEDYDPNEMVKIMLEEPDGMKDLDDDDKVKLVTFNIGFPGGELCKTHLLSRKDWLAEVGQDIMTKGGNRSIHCLSKRLDWDLMLLHVSASRCATVRGATLRNALVEAAMEKARERNAVSYKAFDDKRRSQKIMTCTQMEQDDMEIMVTKATYNIRPNQQWLEMFKNSDVWNAMDQEGVLNEIVQSGLQGTGNTG